MTTQTSSRGKPHRGDADGNEAGPPVHEGGAAADPGAGLDRVATVPNLLSLIRILAIPVIVLLLLRRGTEAAGLILLGVVVSTDWVDGYIARRTGQVTTVGKVLDPLADRLAIGSALVALVVRGAFPLWAALLVLVRDGLVLVGGAIVLLWRGVRLDVRPIGKAATFALMCGIPLVAWSSFGLILAGAAFLVGWAAYAGGVVAYYAAAALYAADVTRAIRESRGASGGRPGEGDRYHSGS